jgi:hypothetical protein
MANTYDDDRGSTTVLALSGVGAAFGAVLGVLFAGFDAAFASALIGVLTGAIIGIWLEQMT